MARHPRPGVAWHRIPIPATLVDHALASMARGSASRLLAPQLRGRVTPRILRALEARGWHVHRIGQAAYLHRDRADALILGVWPRRAAAPSWADRLGHASAAYERRAERLASEQRWRRQHRDERGRFGSLLPWHRWPTPAMYSFEPSHSSTLDRHAADVAAHNHRVRVARELAWSESELRAAWGDR